MTAHATRLEYPKADNGVFTAGVAGRCDTCDWWGDLRTTDSHGHLAATTDISVHVRDAERTKKGTA